MSNSDIDLGDNESYDLQEFPAVNDVDGPCDTLRDGDTLELSAGVTTEINLDR
jgi:hypothetical protein